MSSMELQVTALGYSVPNEALVVDVLGFIFIWFIFFLIILCETRHKIYERSRAGRHFVRLANLLDTRNTQYFSNNLFLNLSITIHKSTTIYRNINFAQRQAEDDSGISGNLKKIQGLVSLFCTKTQIYIYTIYSELNIQKAVYIQTFFSRK